MRVRVWFCLSGDCSFINIFICFSFMLLHVLSLGEVAKLFADAGVICIASLISPYRKDRDACRAMLPNKSFIEASCPCSWIHCN